MINTDAIKSKILSFIERNGPSIPMQIAREIGMNSIFTSAFLSELLDAKKIKTSSVRVGGTVLYLLNGQEHLLEKFHNNLHPKEAEAYEKLKQNKILKDSEQEPAIRVALRAIKDFAFSFKNNEELYWRYLNVSEQEIRDIFNAKENPEKKANTNIKESEPTLIIKQEIIETIKQESEPANNDSDSKELELIISKPIKKEKQEKIKPTLDFENPLALKPLVKPEKIKPKSEFALKVIEFLENNDFHIIEEKDFSKKEYNCIVEFNTQLGPIAFLTQAKDKKSISDIDLEPLLRQAQSIPLPALLVYPDSINKKALEYQKRYYSIIKLLKLK